MGRVLNLRALETYRSKYGVNLREIALRIGIPYSTLSRYVKGDRMPSADVVCRCSNSLFLSIGSLVCESDRLPSDIVVLGEEEWRPVTLKTEAMEAFRLERKWSVRHFLEEVNRLTDSRFEARVYHRFRENDHPSMKFVLAFLNAFDLPVSAVFDDVTLTYVADGQLPKLAMVKRDSLNELRNDLRRSKEEVARLTAENLRLKRTVNRLTAGAGVQAQDTPFFLKKFINKAERNLAELKALLPSETDGEEE